MRKKKEEDITHIPYYRENTLQTLRLLWENPKLLVPDILIIALTILLAFFFLAYNDLLKPLLYSSVRLELLREQFNLATSSASSSTRLLLSFVVHLFAQIIFGVSLSGFRYEYMKDVVTNKKTSLYKAYRRSLRNYFNLMIIKLIFVLITLTLLFIFTTIATATQTWIIYALIPFILLVIFLRISFFFVIQNLYLKKTGLRSLFHSFIYFKMFPKKTLITLLIVSFVDFIASLLFGIFPAFWEKFALRLEVLHITTIAIILFVALRTFVSILVTLWSETLKFLVYTKKE